VAKILNVNGNPYTTAAEDVRMMDLKKQFRDTLGRAVVEAMRKSRDGRILLDMGEISAYLDTAYYMGREDAKG
jgi:hypothetical protein